MEHRLGSVGQAYIPAVTTQLYYTADPKLPPAYLSYSSPYKQWIYDSGIGAVVIDSISGGGFTAPQTRASGVHFDYDNGRVIVPASWGKNKVLTGTYGLKEINTYQVNEDENPLLTASKMFRNPRFGGTPTSGIAPNVLCTPALFVNSLSDNSTPFAFGGIDNTKTTFTLTALVESAFQQTAVLSLFRDARYDYIPLLDLPQDPLDGFGDLKGGTGYSYSNIVAQYGTPGNLIFIERAEGGKVSDNARINPFQFGAVIDLDLSFIRQPS